MLFIYLIYIINYMNININVNIFNILLYVQRRADILRVRGSSGKKSTSHFFFLNKMLNILGMCDIDKKYINNFWDFIDNDRQYFADCVIVLIS